MPSGPVGSVWASGSWSTTAWEADTWADATPVVIALKPEPARFKYNKRTPDRKAYDGGWFDKELGNIQNSQLPFAIRTVTANTTATATDSVILCDATSGAITVTLRDARQMQFAVVTVKKVDSSANIVTLGGDVDGLTHPILSTDNASVTIASNGVVWSIVGHFPSWFGLDAHETGVVNAGYPVGDVRRYGAMGDGVHDDTTAILAALNSTKNAPIKRVYFPSASVGYVMTAGWSIVGNDGYHGLTLVGDGTRTSRIMKQFDGTLFTFDSVLNVSVQDMGFDGNYGTNTGKGFVLTNNCNFPAFDGVDFVGFSDSHIEFGSDAGFNGQFRTRHFIGTGQGDFRAIHVNGPDTSATPRSFSRCMSNGYFQFTGAFDTLITGCFATRYEFDNDCAESCVTSSVWADQQNFLAGIPISIGGFTTCVTGCRIANSIVLIAGSSGALVGNRQSGVLIGIPGLQDNSGGLWSVVHPALGLTYHTVGQSTLTGTLSGEVTSHLQEARPDADLTATVDVEGSTLLFNAPLTAGRTVTLSTTNARMGSRFHIARDGGDTGGPWTLTIAGGTGASLLNNQWCIMEYNGGFWVCIAKGDI